MSDATPARLHGNCGARVAARRLRASLVSHCGGNPSAVQLAIIEQCEELKIRLAVMDEQFIATGSRSAHASRDYLAWSNSLVRLLRQLGLRGVPTRTPTIHEVMAAPRQTAA